MLFRPALLIMAMALCAADAYASPTFTNLGILPGARISRASAVSGDGTVVAGGCYFRDGSIRAFRWTSGVGMQDLGALPGDTDSWSTGISADGSTIVGIGADTDNNQHAFRWTSAGGLQSLDALPGAQWTQGNGISGDGSAVAGNWGTDGFTRAFLWTRTGRSQDLGLWSAGYDASADAISADGLTVVGSATAGVNRSIAFRWTAQGGMEDLGALPGGRVSISSARAVSRDGSVVAGLSYLDNGDNAASPRATRWTAGAGMQNLGVLPEEVGSWANATSGDGSVVAGVCTAGEWSANRPFLWTAALGMVDLNTYLASLGLDLTGWTLTDATGLSMDGSAMTGWGTYNGDQRAWLVTALPEPASGALLGLALLCIVRLRRKGVAQVL